MGLVIPIPPVIGLVGVGMGYHGEIAMSEHGGGKG